MKQIRVVIGTNSPIMFEAEILYQGKDELGDGSPCRAIKLRGKVDGKGSVKTITFRSPFCKWKVLNDTSL